MQNDPRIVTGYNGDNIRHLEDLYYNARSSVVGLTGSEKSIPRRLDTSCVTIYRTAGEVGAPSCLKIVQTFVVMLTLQMFTVVNDYQLGYGDGKLRIGIGNCVLKRKEGIINNSTSSRTSRLWYRTVTGALWDCNKRLYLPHLFFALINEEVKYI